MTLRTVSLDDKYIQQEGRIFITGTQALVRLPLMQHLRDKAEGFHTGGYISGYRGSPLGGYDQQLWAAKKHLQAHHVVFNPGVNEDLAATACWGTQQLGFHGETDYKGVFAIWYGKGPGVDRTGDAFRHGNLAGSHPKGGVLALMGDDHTCESSTTAHQSEYAMVDAMMPVLNPAGVQELLDYGIYGWALSRYAGVWVGLKCMKDTIDASATVDVSPQRVQIRTPDRLPDACGRPQHSLARSSARAGDAAAHLEAGSGQSIRPRQPARPRDLRFAQCEARHRHLRQVLHGRAPGAPVPGHRRDRSAAAGPAPVQGRHDLPARAAGRGRFRAGAREDHRRRGEARADRAAAQGNPVRRRERAADRRQARRARRHPVPKRRCARSEPHRSGDRPAHPRADSGRPARRARQGPGAPRERVSWRSRPWTARRTSAPAARTTRARRCRKAASRWRASAATSWRSGWIAAPPASPRWAPRARAGWARRRSSRPSTCSRTSATAPTSTPASWRCAQPSRRA